MHPTDVFERGRWARSHGDARGGAASSHVEHCHPPGRDTDNCSKAQYWAVECATLPIPCGERTGVQVGKRQEREPTYHMGLRLAVMALRVEAALGLEVRWDCARRHGVCVCVLRGVEGKIARGSAERVCLKGTVSGSVLAR
jgi:hypothetical protein